MLISLAIFAECSQDIGTGHLIESFNILKLALTKGHRVSMWLSDTTPVSILEKFSYPYKVFHSFSKKEGLRDIQERLIRDSYNVVLFNFRKIDNETVKAFKDSGFRVICIDELGNRRLDCDIIINPSIVDKYYNYPSYNNRLKVYTGPRYLSIAPGFTKVHLQKRIFSKQIKNMSICMGGVDRTATTLKIIDTLADWKVDVKKNIILGAGFSYIDDVYKRIECLKDRNFKVYHNIDNIESLLLESDFVFTAGGNTLYELACIGTPAVVLYEDEHEKENGLAFEGYGFSFCLGRGADVSKKDILGAINKFEDIKVRHTYSFKGKEIVDGKGSERILDIIERLKK